MTSIFRGLVRKGIIQDYPEFVETDMQYEVIMGSQAYGVANSESDVDIYGFCIPPKDMVFPHLSGEIQGFGTQKQRFEQYQSHHVNDISSGNEYDITIYSIVKYFQLCMQNNPNMLDSLFAPSQCVTYSTDIGEHIRENRRMFLHKGSWYKFKGYAYSQLRKMDKSSSKNIVPSSKRALSIEQYGYDIKFAYHLVRLMGEVRQILLEHDLDITRNSEQLKSIRRGDWTKEQVIEYFKVHEQDLEEAYEYSTLQYSPDEGRIKKLLLECLEVHYGSIGRALNSNIPVDKILEYIEGISQFVLEIRSLLEEG